MEKPFPPLLLLRGKGKKEAGHLEGADSSNVGTDSILVRIQVIQPPPLFPVHSSFLFVFFSSLFLAALGLHFCVGFL